MLIRVDQNQELVISTDIHLTLNVNDHNETKTKKVFYNIGVVKNEDIHLYNNGYEKFNAFQTIKLSVFNRTLENITKI